MARKNKAQKNDKMLTLKRRLLAHNSPKDPVAEQYRTIRTNIQFSNVDQDIKTIVVTSSGAEEGKSTTASNLATVYAQQGLKVLLIDADLRKPTGHYTFRLENHIGLTNVLTRQSTLAQAVQESEIPHLSVLTSGPIPPNPSELLASAQMAELLKEMKEQFDMIIFDTPPILAVADAQILANQVDGTILVVSSGKTEKDAALKSKELLSNAQGKLLGVVLNNRKVEEGNYYYYYGTN
ncbi:CpsD/CapB family tyrosine-protein kinase [Priestia megaterium]|uniref:non-specific protein-tyrosine kinase n=1 Tax=Priestia megaterium (strain ATCC 14581 / DSM 32 / CCUG 1817 / JCM 2506 / NBRC 15308 / NCIMB 9376 / NCTC 10342 / NRRL B-14308 / VKM B-512 / Ford 19) TaxID=1348623 RepID=A0A0B6A6P9_PRIM2|nr:CpsD/CapB family tyrosine-protein kinase [Priestia megaterium]AJI20615.1 tyrosine-protein kinase YwqD [Priestia megaterium NBRC 15308 = ATCC 14581]KFM96146.1 tyrosine-protein kinase YwqD [Priestia megaterium]KGJ85372.1 capsular biosynthesis protein [Priestia megaterium NBRC 15308 = ATCC 14581]MDR4233394.1 CpsD/CapB family tyrosine-protein kinase [Priestia megaterium]MED3807096.1 CpsD/CapB family tyrosine-protein kinase [Priestia megaterium]